MRDEEYCICKSYDPTGPTGKRCGRCWGIPRLETEEGQRDGDGDPCRESEGSTMNKHPSTSRLDAKATENDRPRRVTAPAIPYDEGDMLATAEQQNVIDGLNEMVKELTKHADALRSDLDDALTALAAGGRDWPRATIAAYDNFIREA